MTETPRGGSVPTESGRSPLSDTGNPHVSGGFFSSRQVEHGASTRRCSAPPRR